MLWLIGEDVSGLLKTALSNASFRVPSPCAALLRAVTSGLQVRLFPHGLFPLVEKEPLPKAVCPPKQMTVQNGRQLFAWHEVRGDGCKSAEKQDGLSAREPEGKEGNSSHIWKGNALSGEVARRKHWRHRMFVQRLLVTVSLGKRCAHLPTIASSIISVCLSSPLPPRQQRCATAAERLISIIQLMNTEWPQAVLMKKVRRVSDNNLQSFTSRRGISRETGQRKNRNNLCFIFKRIQTQKGCGYVREYRFSFQWYIRY